MFPLPDVVFNRCRSWLNFREIHASRSVSKSWHNTSGVAKVFSVEDLFPHIPTPHADFTHVNEIELMGDRYSQEQLQKLTECAFSVFQQSANHLKKIILFGNEFMELATKISTLPNVCDAHFCTVDDFSFQKFISLLPNLQNLSIAYIDGKIAFDFELLPNLVELTLQGIRFREIRNGDKCRINKIRLMIDFVDEDDDEHGPDINSVWNNCFLNNLKVASVENDLLGFRNTSFFYFGSDIELTLQELQNWFEKSPTLSIHTHCCFKDLRFSYHFGNGKLVISKCSQIPQDFSDIGLHTSFLKKFFGKWQNIRPFTLEIDPKITDDVKMKLLIIIGASMFFSLEKIKDIVKGL